MTAATSRDHLKAAADAARPVAETWRSKHVAQGHPFPWRLRLQASRCCRPASP